MFRRLFGTFDWKTSPAHLLLLSKFLRPKALEYFFDRSEWEEIQKEKPLKAINRFKTDGYLTEDDLESKLAFRYNYTEIQALCKEQGLKASGKKSVLIQRLIEQDEVGMNALVRDIQLLVCTSLGEELATEYISTENEKRRRAEEDSFQALQLRDFHKASTIVAVYESQQLFPRGIGIDWKEYNPDGDIAFLTLLFSSMPRLLNITDEKISDALKQAAGMMHLWGTSNASSWLPTNFDTNISLGAEEAARMLLFNASFKSDIIYYKKSGVKEVEVLGARDSCPKCQEINQKKFNLVNIPELPYEKCTSPIGCRCTTTVALNLKSLD